MTVGIRMSTAAKPAGFGLGLAVLFGLAFALVGWVGPPTSMAGMEAAGAGGHLHPAGQHQHGDQAGHQHGESGGDGGHPVGGLGVADHGYQLRLLSGDPVAGRPCELAFQVIGPSWLPVTSFVNNHDKPLHLIIARRDLSGFQHLHPVRDAFGTWLVPLTLPAAGDYRAIADFVPDGHTDTLVLGTDLIVAGDYRPVSLPAPASEATVDGYTVWMLGRPTAGESSQVRFARSVRPAPR